MATDGNSQRSVVALRARAVAHVGEVRVTFCEFAHAIDHPLSVCDGRRSHSVYVPVIRNRYSMLHSHLMPE